MPMLVFMPWCRIDRTYDLPCFRIVPFSRQRRIDGLDEDANDAVNSLLEIYKTIEGDPVPEAALFQFDRERLTNDLSDEEREIVYELVTLVCFSGLARREHIGSVGPYCNSDCFIVYVQRFQSTDFIVLTPRRRAGSSFCGWGTDKLRLTVPVNCHDVHGVVLDEPLLRALVEHRRQSATSEWARWQNAISCFNQANTDSENVRYQVEWVLLCSAFEYLLHAESKAKDVAARFAKVLVPSEEVLARGASRRPATWTDDAKSLRYEWMKEFYRIRGDFAHGVLDTAQPMVWNPLEHLVLATIVFPLLVKCLLSTAGTYTLTEEDQVQIDSFEQFADTLDFLRPPPDQQSSMDSHWGRIRGDRRRQITVQRAVQHYEALLAARRDTDSEAEVSQAESEE